MIFFCFADEEERRRRAFCFMLKLVTSVSWNRYLVRVPAGRCYSYCCLA